MAPKVTRINLAGWKKVDMPQDWLDFIKEEKARKDSLCSWVEADPDDL